MLPKRPPRALERVTFDLASDADDERLRQLLRETPMGGRIELAFSREPSYFSAAQITGPVVQTLVARHADCGEIAGTATRALRPAFINGQAVETGHLGDLRLRPEYRSGMTLARGYRFLRELHDDGRARIYSTVIVEDNHLALQTIAANRAGLPRYTDLGRVLTPMIRLHRPRSVRNGNKRFAACERETVERGSLEALPAIVRRLNESRLQFSPVWTEYDFLSGRLKDFHVDDFYVLRRDGRIAGVLGVWDQRAFRQTVVLGYRGALRWVRPFVNALPAPGEPLRFFYVAFIATDDVDAFRSLLRQVYSDASCGRLWNRRIGDARTQKSYSHFVIGLHERDPRTSVLEGYPRRLFAGRLFAVTFEESQSGRCRIDSLRPSQLDGRVPYVDPALL